VSITSLRPVEGPECPRCGCTESVVLPGGGSRWFSAVNPKTGQPWGQDATSQRRRCRHCGQEFHAVALDLQASPPAESVSAEPALPAAVRYYVLRCPACRSDRTKVTKTMHPKDGPTVRYHKCQACGHKFKSVESEG